MHCISTNVILLYRKICLNCYRKKKLLKSYHFCHNIQILSILSSHSTYLRLLLTSKTINLTKRNFQSSYVTKAMKFALASLILRLLKIALYVYSLVKLAVRSTRFSASVRKFHSSFEITQCPRILVH